MIKLTVSKFRQWDAAEWTFPESGLIRLSGDSEAGKSSIMYAIAWALWGKHATNNVTTIGAKGAEVTLDGIGLSITRRKNPERLCSGELEGDAAQAHVERILGMDANQFLASGFIQQKLKGSLLTLQPAEQLRFVQKLAFGDDDPEIYRQLIVNKIKDIEMEVLSSSTTIQALVSQRDELAHSLVPNVNAQAIEEQIKVLESESQRIESRAADLSQKLNEITNQRASIHSQLVVAIGHCDNLRRIQEQISDVQEQLDKYQSIDGSTDVQGLLATTSERLRLCQEQERWLRDLEIFRNAMQGHGLDPNQAPNVLLGKVESNKRLLEEQEAKIIIEITEMLDVAREMKAAQSLLTCPHCSNYVRYLNKSLVSAEVTVNPADLATLETQINSKQSQVNEIKRSLRSVCDAINHINTWCAKGAAPLPKAHTLDILQAARNQIAQSQQTLLETQAAIATKVALAAQKQSLEAECLSATRLAHGDPLLLQSEIDKCTGIMDDLQANISQCQSERNRIHTILLDCRQRLRLAITNMTVQKQLDNVNGRLQDANAKYERIVASLGDAQRLKMLSDQAATEAVASILHSINANAKVYLDILFPGCGTSIQLKHEKINKTDSKAKAQFSVSIIHNGVSYGSLDEFSGGAMNRAILAFQLALSDLYNNPILLLDEPFAGSHPSLRDDCIEALKTIGTRKLILMAEHGCIDAQFDDAIYVK